MGRKESNQTNNKIYNTLIQPGPVVQLVASQTADPGVTS